jgi:hypothetical protein
MTTNKRFTCRICGAVLPAWLLMAKRPDGAMLLQPVGQDHPDQVGLYLDRMHRTEDIGTLAAEAFKVVED